MVQSGMQMTRTETALLRLACRVGWDGGNAPKAYNTGTPLPTAEMAKTMDGYVYLDRPLDSNFTGAILEVINADGDPAGVVDAD